MKSPKLSAFFKKIGANREVLALSIGRFGDGIGNSLLFVVIPLYIAQLPAPDFPFPKTVRAGILLSLLGFTAGLVQPLAGALIDRLNRRKPFILGGLTLLAAATATYTLAEEYYQAMIIRVFQGLGLALTIPPTLALLTRSTEKSSRGGSMGIFSTFRVISLAVGPLLGGIVHDHFGFAATFYAGAGFILLGAVLVLFWVKEIRIDEPAPPFKLIDRSVLARGLPALGFSTFVMTFAFAMIAPIEQRINARVNETATMFGFAFSAVMASRIIIQVPIGHLSDRKGRKKLIMAGLALMALATVPIGYVTHAWQLVGLRVLQGIASGGIAAPVFALAGDLSRSGGEGRQMSIVTTGFALGIAFGTLSSGLLAVFSLALPFMVASLMALIAVAWVGWRVPETVGRD
jgi:MFS family permease